MRHLNFLRLSGFAAVMTGLTACGSDQAEFGATGAFKSAAMSTSDSLRGKDKADAAAPITRASLANIITPVDLVTIERRGAQGVIAKIATNRGVETWSSIDKKTIAMRDGVIVGTRGLGEDLMAAATPLLGQIRGGVGSYSRTHTLLDGEDKPVYHRYNCSANQAGSETITVVERSFAVMRVTETCKGPSGGFSNDFWFQNDGKLRKSRQWISESVGYVAIEHLR